jgi:hypothetical protein
VNRSDLNRRPEFGLAEPISLGYRSTFYDHWRPVTAVRAADTDDNPVTEPDPEWSSLIPTPAFPAYTSGHSTFSATAATILPLVLVRDEIPFGAASDGLPRYDAERLVFRRRRTRLARVAPTVESTGSTTTWMRSRPAGRSARSWSRISCAGAERR